MAQIIQIGHNAWREASADTAGVLVDAADYYRAFYLAAESARRYIFLTIGSANLTNRSMGLDSELHASWEVPSTVVFLDERHSGVSWRSTASWVG